MGRDMSYMVVVKYANVNCHKEVFPWDLLIRFKIGSNRWNGKITTMYSRALAQWNMNFKPPFAPFLFYMDLYKSNLSHKILNAKNLGAFFSLHFMLLLLQLSYIFPTPNILYFVDWADEKP